MRAMGLPKDQPLTSKASPPNGARVLPLKARRAMGLRERAFQSEVQAAGLMRDRCCS